MTNGWPAVRGASAAFEAAAHVKKAHRHKSACALRVFK